MDEVPDANGNSRDHGNSFAYHYLCLTHDEKLGWSLQLLYCDGAWPEGKTKLALEDAVAVPPGPVKLRIEVRGAVARFRDWKDDAWLRTGPRLDHSALSDEGGEGEHANFTGAFVGMAANDTSGQAMFADFPYFRYRSRSSTP